MEIPDKDKGRGGVVSTQTSKACAESQNISNINSISKEFPIGLKYRTQRDTAGGGMGKGFRQQGEVKKPDQRIKHQ